jgi:hypothetical protein
VGDQAVCGKLAAEETLELANLGGPKALGVAEDSDRWGPRRQEADAPIYERQRVRAS